MYTHFVWLRNTKGGFDAQLWTTDYTVGTAPGGNYRKDMPYQVGERVAVKVKLAAEDCNITLAEAKRKFPAPTGAAQ